MLSKQQQLRRASWFEVNAFEKIEEDLGKEKSHNIKGRNQYERKRERERESERVRERAREQEREQERERERESEMNNRKERERERSGVE